MKTKYLENKWHCLILFILCFATYTCVYMTKNMFSAAMASIVSEGIMTKSQVGAISAAYWLVYAPFQIIGGFLTDKYSPFALVSIGLIGSAVSNLIIYTNQSYTVIMIAWIFSAAIQFGVWPGVFKILTDQLNPHYRDKAVFGISFAISVGIALSMITASFVSAWKYNFLFSVILLLALFIAWIFIYGILKRKMRVVEIANNDIEIENENKSHVASMYLLTFKTGFWIIAIVGFFRWMIDTAVVSVTPTMLMESYDGLSSSFATVLSILLVVFSTIGIFISGIVQKRITGNEATASMLFMSACLLPIGVACFVGKLNYLIVLLCLSLSMMLLNGATPFTNSFLASRFVKYGRSGTMWGILNGLASVGNVFASIVFVYIADGWSWNAVVISWLAIMILCVVLCLLVMKRWKSFIEGDIL